MYTLKDVPIGGSVKVLKVHGEGPVRRRIIEVTLRGYMLSLRKEDAGMIEVEAEG